MPVAVWMCAPLHQMLFRHGVFFKLVTKTHSDSWGFHRFLESSHRHFTFEVRHEADVYFFRYRVIDWFTVALVFLGARILSSFRTGNFETKNFHTNNLKHSTRNSEHLFPNKHTNKQTLEHPNFQKIIRHRFDIDFSKSQTIFVCLYCYQIDVDGLPVVE